MNNRLTYTGQTINNFFPLVAIVILVCMMSIVSFSTAFADAPDMEG